MIAGAICLSLGRSSPIIRAANGPKQSPQPQRIKGPTLPDVISAQRIAQIAAIPDTAIDTSDIPEADAAFEAFKADVERLIASMQARLDGAAAAVAASERR